MFYNEGSIYSRSADGIEGSRDAAEKLTITAGGDGDEGEKVDGARGLGESLCRIEGGRPRKVK